MTEQPSTAKEAEPIEAEFEPAYAGAEPKTGSRRAWSAAVSRLEAVGWAAGGATLGAIVAIAANNAGSGMLTGGLRTEVDAIAETQTLLQQRADGVASEMVDLRAKADAQASRIARGDEGVAAVRSELAEIKSQLASLFGTAPGAGALAENPLRGLMARIEEIETALETEETSPRTTRQMQRSVRELTDQVAALEEASEEFSLALDRRQATLDVLEKSLEQLSADIDDMEARLTGAEAVGAEIGDVRQKVENNSRPVLEAAAQARTLTALDALVSAAEKGKPFPTQFETLARLMPLDRELDQLREIARRGAPSIDQLRSEFDGAARAAEQSAAAQDDDGWNWLRGAVSGVVKIRRTNADETTTTLVREARSALVNGDVAAAVRAIDGLKLAPAAAFKSWRETAVRRARLDEQLEALNVKLVRPTAPTADGE